MSTQSSPNWFPIIVMILAPVAFSTNLIFGRYVAPESDPFILAFIRWACVAIILLPFAIKSGGAQMMRLIRTEWPFFLFLSFLGMGISGSGVYLGLQSTTATNATLIYSTAPILIILLERVFAARKSNPREGLGIAVAFVGVVIIVAKGSFNTIAQFAFNPGDLLIALAALSWAGYSILYRSERFSGLSSVTLFGIIAIFGAIINLPVATYAFYTGAQLPHSASAWSAVAGIIFISSLIAFSAYQYGVRALGASIAGLFMYLMTPYGVLMAVIFLGEELLPFHIIGIICVMVGVTMATFPKSMLDKFKRKAA
ncbi:DMT family transporter [Ahrensia kielensis]|uniref:DMT family transporter n=1 Tax=Ahrensia kielensis TaxID=76980 RepID=A0ABU9T427_9HYPH